MDKLPVLDEPPAKSKEPVLEYEPPKKPKEPVLLATPEERKWSFSFRYWNQIKYFGLDQSEPKWFVSLLEKLKDLGCKKIDSFLSDHTERDSWRYHKINWNQKNIPIKRHDLDWVDDAYLQNEEEYPLLQFQVSKALGRVIGFWDENLVFNVVLLDPLHNIQPSKDHGYKVDTCAPLSCEYSAILYEIDTIKSASLCGDDCGYRLRLNAFPTRMPAVNVIMHYVSDEQKAEIDKALELFGDDSSCTDLLLLGAQELTLSK